MNPGQRAGWFLIGTIAITGYCAVTAVGAIAWELYARIHGRRYAAGAESSLSQWP